MIPFETEFPDIAHAEILSLHIGDDKILPEGNYAFIEYYCPNNDCDCQGGTLQVVKYGKYAGHQEKLITSITFSWKDSQTIGHWDCQLGEDEEETPEAKRLLELFKEVLQDSEYSEPFQRHYYLFKKRMLQEEEERDIIFPKQVIKSNKIGRNDPCFCGSGKKFKKCCIDKR